MTKKEKGTMMTLAAGLAWGISGISGQYLMSHGVHVNLLTSLRLLITGIFLLSLARSKQKEHLVAAWKQPKFLMQVLLFSIFGLVLNQYAFLRAIHLTNAGTATVLQYMAPILILSIVCILNRQRPTSFEIIAIAMAILGTYMIATHGKLGSLAITPKGLMWGLGSAITYSIYILLPVKLIHEWGSTIVIGSGMFIGGILFSLVTKAWQYPLQINVMSILAYIGIIGIGTIFAYTFFLKGVSIVGAVKGSLLASVEPVSSVFLTVLVLGEIFYPIDLLGMLFIFLAVTLISYKDLIALKKMKRVK
ncbi:TPA: EamA family transporter [Streptococcus agalactiae]|uniref:DMT family transporter n=1 Tax=Streptococcus agalactiae TaxID=1311 RepID=UPI0002BC586F|nr:DMT family transporter [Streptococcus agalactiae]EPT48220.1 multidrug DMT transporter permease [Streptococcus agalactiae FSL F2-343]EPW34010.1 multidrug DMT transporter permease [Streptococcus agalactiae CCUG 44110]EPW99334.1 multidrug DMT transporter permease [Streptococcus agalactiae MRI Z1-035]KAA8989842.1 EamA family transporter [Streptococcus agalactiae]KAA9044198.1 EamA family transporter [Streptococcus agalactiae]